MPPPGPRVLWTPPPDVRETTEIGRYLAWLERERGLVFADYDGAAAVVGRRSAGVLVVDLGLLRGEGARAVQHRPRHRTRCPARRGSPARA